ncbi:TPA_asm: UL22 uORF 1 [Human alphaherpesvirus 1]|nr:TPA_asm: UL22 uORF 1 [Human alphaherpesvirus 1]
MALCRYPTETPLGPIRPRFFLFPTPTPKFG